MVRQGGLSKVETVVEPCSKIGHFDATDSTWIITFKTSPVRLCMCVCVCVCFCAIFLCVCVFDYCVLGSLGSILPSERPTSLCGIT